MWIQFHRQTVSLQTILLSISTQFKCEYSLIVKSFQFQAIQFRQTVLIHTIQFSISSQFVLFKP